MDDCKKFSETLKRRFLQSLFNLIIHQPDIDKISLYAKDPYEVKHQLLINKKESTRLTHLNDSKAFMNTKMI